MRPRLHPKAKLIAKRSWSFRLSLVGTVCGAVMQVLPYVADRIHPLLAVGLAVAGGLGVVLAPAGAALARVTHQTNLED